MPTNQFPITYPLSEAVACRSKQTPWTDEAGKVIDLYCFFSDAYNNVGPYLRAEYSYDKLKMTGDLDPMKSYIHQTLHVTETTKIHKLEDCKDILPLTQLGITKLAQSRPNTLSRTLL